MTPDSLASFVDYIHAHPIANIEGEQYLRYCVRNPEAILDFREQGFLAVIMDGVTGAGGLKPFSLVAMERPSLSVDEARRLIEAALSRASLLKISALEWFLHEFWQPHRALLESYGFSLACREYEMRCHQAGPPAKPIPEGWHWDDAITEKKEYVRVLRAAFAQMDGIFLPEEGELLRRLEEPDKRARILIAEKRGVALTRVNIKRNYIHLIARDPVFRGQGVGELAMDEALRLLPRRPVDLTVVTHNQPAVSLYQKYGFGVEREDIILAYRFLYSSAGGGSDQGQFAGK